MADTSRTLAALLALLADNTTGAISPQDLRDALLSCMSGYGSITVLGASAAQTSISATPAKLTGFTANGPSSQMTVDHTTDTITVGITGVYKLRCQVSFSGTASKTFLFRAYVNGVVTTLGCTRMLGASGDVGSCGFGGLLALTASDAVTVYISSSDGGTALTVADAQLSLVRVE